MDEEEKKNGLVEKGKEEVKQKTKKMKKRIIRAAIPYIAITLIILCVASAVFATISAVIDLLKGAGQAIVNLFTVDTNGIKISDEEIDKLIATLEASGIDLEDLELLRRY